MQPNYKFYPTLLDAFQYYLNSEQESAFEEFINKLNRVPFTSEAAEKGTAFNDLIDTVIIAFRDNDVDFIQSYNEIGEDDKIQWKGFEFKKKIVHQFYYSLKYSYPQVFVKATLPTSKGLVLLYGYIDNTRFGSPVDIKTTGKYEFPKYLANWQHIVYPYCLIHGHGVQPEAACLFSYEVTDFNNIYKEDYMYDEERDLKRLVSHVEHLISFIEQHRHLITDKKLFALDEPKEEVSAE